MPKEAKMKLSEKLVVCEHCEKTIAENTALKRALRHAHYSVHWHDPDGCSGCEEVDALLTAKEQDANTS